MSNVRLLLEGPSSLDSRPVITPGILRAAAVTRDVKGFAPGGRWAANRTRGGISVTIRAGGPGPTSANERFPAPLAFGSLRERGAERMEGLTYRVLGSPQR